MKKKTKKLNVIMSLIIVFTLLLGCGALTYQKAVWVKNDMYEDIEGLPDYFHDCIEDYYKWGEKEVWDAETHLDSENALGIIPSFYLAHEDMMNNPFVSSDAGFHSMLKNSKGETIAEYQPYIVFEKDINNIKKHDVRVLILGEEFAEEYRDLYYTDSTDLDSYKRDALIQLSDVGGYSKDAFESLWGGTLKITGTCDDVFVYPEKLTWYDPDYHNTYGFIPEKNQTANGTTDFEEWFDYDYDDDNYNYSYDHNISMESVKRMGLWNTKYNREAEEVCEQGFESLSENPDDCWEVFDKGFFTSIVRRTDYVTGFYDDGKEDYVYSCAYVFHPLKIAMAALEPVYIVAAAIAVVLIIFICVLINKVFKEPEIVCKTGPENNFVKSEEYKDSSTDVAKDLNDIEKD